MSKQLITTSTRSYVGSGVFPPMMRVNERKGAPIDWLTRVSLGTPLVADTNAFISAATSTELPNNATKTYTTANAGSSPLDDAGRPSTTTITATDGASYSVFVMDVARNVTIAASHNSSLVAMTVTVTGFDEWFQKVVETLSISATGTLKTATGKKAFRYVYSIAIVSAGNATTNTLGMGFGSVFGLPYKLTNKADLFKLAFGSVVDDQSGVTAAVSSTATATTGDVRGTVALGGAVASANPVQTVVAGDAAGDITVTGVAATDRLVSVIGYIVSADTGTEASGNKVTNVVNLTSQFTITAADTINNTGGTNTTGYVLVVTYQDYAGNVADGSGEIVAWYYIHDRNSADGLKGVAQYAG